jgi:nitrogen regulatory protein PII-like uncharacterized protein
MTKEQREKLIEKIMDENTDEVLFTEILKLDLFGLIREKLDEKSDDELLDIIL